VVVAGALALFAAIGPQEAGAASATSVTSGGDFSCAVTEAGAAMCWGYSATGQLGTGVIDGPDICGGGSSNEYPCAKSPVQVTGLTSGVKSVSAGDSFACAVMTDDTVKCWGRNDFGQLGSGALGPDSCSDIFGTNLQCSTTPVDVTGLTDVDRVDAGVNHACALTNGGGVFCWGYGALAQLGDNGPDQCGSTECSLAPIGTPFQNGVKDLAVGGFHTCIISQQDEALCWGNNDFGQVGSGVVGPDDCFAGRTFKCSRDAAAVEGLMSGVTDITAGTNHACAIHNSVVKCWGYNGQYQLARDEPDSCANISSECFSRSPVTIPGVGGEMIEAGDEHTCVSSGSEIQCWGRNLGQLDGGSGPDECPTGLACSQDPIGPDGILGDIAQIAPGSYHTCVLLETGTVQCWGDGFYGQMGNGEGEKGTEATIPNGFAGSVVTPTPLPALVWGDFDCSGVYDANDALVIAAWWAELELSAAHPAGLLACPEVSGHPQINGGEGIWADSNCLDDVTLEDALVLLKDLAGIATAGLPPFCPELGEAIEVG
jgi:alpha-tubulin suppressor-like RCC1 family protein